MSESRGTHAPTARGHRDLWGTSRPATRAARGYYLTRVDGCWLRKGHGFQEWQGPVAAGLHTGPMGAKAPLQVRRWRRYGNDRLYVRSSSGTEVGWYDLLADVAHPASPEQLATLIEAVDCWRGRVAPTLLRSAVATVTEAVDEPVAEPVADASTDLSGNAAGALVREQAVAAKQAAPVRTFVAWVMGIHTAERAWRLGAVGEEKVGEQLARLVKKDPRWRVVHAIPVGHAALTSTIWLSAPAAVHGERQAPAGRESLGRRGTRSW